LGVVAFGIHGISKRRSDDGGCEDEKTYSHILLPARKRSKLIYLGDKAISPSPTLGRVKPTTRIYRLRFSGDSSCLSR
jgi:hypothetical protein